MYRAGETFVSSGRNSCIVLVELFVSAGRNSCIVLVELFFLADNTDEMNRQIRVIGRTDVPERIDIKKDGTRTIGSLRAVVVLDQSL